MSEPDAVDAYIADADEDARPTLEALREIVTSTVPEAEEGISYNVPFYRFHGTHVGITAFTNHATFGIGADAPERNTRYSTGSGPGGSTPTNSGRNSLAARADGPDSAVWSRNRSALLARA